MDSEQNNKDTKIAASNYDAVDNSQYSVKDNGYYGDDSKLDEEIHKSQEDQINLNMKTSKKKLSPLLLKFVENFVKDNITKVTEQLKEKSSVELLLNDEGSAAQGSGTKHYLEDDSAQGKVYGF